jgi:hypothetical protein
MELVSLVQIFSSAPYSQTLNLCYFHNVTDEVSYPYKPSKIIVFFLIFTFLDTRREDKDSELHGHKHSLNLICS